MSKCVSVASRYAFAFAFMAAAWSPASAADLGGPDRSYKDYGDPIVVPQSYFSWTGFYIGGHLGYGMGTSSSVDASGGAFNDLVNGFEIDPSGWLGGLTIGYNWQTDAFVFGLEGDLGYLDAHDRETASGAFAEAEYAGYGTLTARIGYSDSRWLFYAKGGLALADITNRAGDIGDGTDITRISEVRSGWALGGGVEHAFQHDMSLKVEYLYMDFGDDNSGNTDGDIYRHENDIHTLKVGFNYSLQRTFDALE